MLVDDVVALSNGEVIRRSKLAYKDLHLFESPNNESIHYCFSVNKYLHVLLPCKVAEQ